MDFKVAGTAEGITALQMDIKITGVTQEIMRNALDQAKRALAAGHSGEDFAALTGHLADEGEANGH